MNISIRWVGLRTWSKTLNARLFLILFVGLVMAYGLSFSVLFVERYMSAKAVMLGTLESDVATSIAILDRLPVAERKAWLNRLSRGNYQFVLGSGAKGIPDSSQRGLEIASRIEEAIGGQFPITLDTVPSQANRLQAHLNLSDGSPLTIDVSPKSVIRIADWLPYVLAIQLGLLLFFVWIAVRQAVRPIADLAAAADLLDPEQRGPRLSEDGPIEVAHAAKAFNSMRDRIAQYLDERVQMLAAISHDLQTPITRIRLRIETAQESPEKEKLLDNVFEIQRLVQEGVAYAKSAHGSPERISLIDVRSFVESLVHDYQDTGANVAVAATTDGTVATRPYALRRVLSNLIDNALKFAGQAELAIERRGEGAFSIRVLDRGPGIPEHLLTAALKPFFRLEQSRNRETGGTGLGLAIAQQLARSIGANLELSNRSGGGLMAEVRF